MGEREEKCMEHHPVVLSEKIAIGISMCAMGCPVRYNGKGIDVLAILGREKQDFTWCPVCPECEAGLGVTREPVHLTSGCGDDVWTGEAGVRNRAGKVVTEEMLEGCKDSLKTLRRCKAKAFVYMDGSPSCGVYRTTLKNTRRGKPPGVFGSLLLKEGYFLIPSSDLQSPLKWWDWRRRLLAFHWFANLQLSNMQEIYDTWYRLKFLCQELDNTWAREMGRTLASLSKENFGSFEPEFRLQVLNLLRRPSTPAKITNSLWKHYSHYRKRSGKIVEEINSPDFKRNVTTIAKELLKMERTSVEDDFLFGASPVIYRDQRRMQAIITQKTEEPKD
jgi:uncharacterized protein YbbK (DUF523 family)